MTKKARKKIAKPKTTRAWASKADRQEGVISFRMPDAMRPRFEKALADRQEELGLHKLTRTEFLLQIIEKELRERGL